MKILGPNARPILNLRLSLAVGNRCRPRLPRRAAKQGPSPMRKRGARFPPIARSRGRIWFSLRAGIPNAGAPSRQGRPRAYGRPTNGAATAPKRESPADDTPPLLRFASAPSRGGRGRHRRRHGVFCPPQSFRQVRKYVGSAEPLAAAQRQGSRGTCQVLMKILGPAPGLWAPH